MAFGMQTPKRGPDYRKTLRNRGNIMSKYFSWDQVLLPCPKPLEASVDAGVFGVCADNSLRPGTEEIVAMTEEQARSLLSTLCDIRHLERCLRRHLNPRTQVNP